MNAEEWLLNIRGIEDEICELKRSHSRALERATVSSSVITTERVMCTQKNSSEEKMAEVSEYALLIAQAIQKKEQLRKEAFILIDQLGNKNLRRILRMYYLEAMTWEQVAENMNMSVRYVSGRLKEQALMKIERIRERSAL